MPKVHEFDKEKFERLKKRYEFAKRNKEFDSDNTVVVEGITAVFELNKDFVKKHEESIYKMLKQLPDNFQIDKGGGWSFLNSCFNKDGNQWTGLHKIMEILLILGIATGKAKILLTRDKWINFPGGMPYFVVF